MGRPLGSRNKSKKKTETITPKETPQSPTTYVISLTLGGQTLKGQGETALEALTAINVPLKIVTKGTLVVRHGAKERKQLLMPIAIKRLFFPKSRIFLAKALQFGL